jgi:hypothetical protein
MLEGLVGVIVLFAAYAYWALDRERKRAIDRERELLSAILAKDVGQYIQSIENLRKTPKDKLAEMKLENELAREAVRLEESQGIAVR